MFYSAHGKSTFRGAVRISEKIDLSKAQVHIALVTSYETNLFDRPGHYVPTQYEIY